MFPDHYHVEYPIQASAIAGRIVAIPEKTGSLLPNLPMDDPDIARLAEQIPQAQSALDAAQADVRAAQEAVRASNGEITDLEARCGEIRATLATLEATAAELARANIAAGRGTQPTAENQELAATVFRHQHDVSATEDLIAEAKARHVPLLATVHACGEQAEAAELRLRSLTLNIERIAVLHDCEIAFDWLLTTLKAAREHNQRVETLIEEQFGPSRSRTPKGELLALPGRRYATRYGDGEIPEGRIMARGGVALRFARDLREIEK